MRQLFWTWPQVHSASMSQRASFMFLIEADNVNCQLPVTPTYLLPVVMTHLHYVFKSLFESWWAAKHTTFYSDSLSFASHCSSYASQYYSQTRLWICSLPEYCLLTEKVKVHPDIALNYYLLKMQTLPHYGISRMPSFPPVINRPNLPLCVDFSLPRELVNLNALHGFAELSEVTHGR